MKERQDYYTIINILKDAKIAREGKQIITLKYKQLNTLDCSNYRVKYT